MPSGDETEVIIFSIAGCFALWSTLATLGLVYKHLRNFSERKLQVRVVRILFMVPIYAILSWLSIRFRDAAIFFDLVRDSYEAYTLFQFYMLLEGFLAQELRQVAGEVADHREDLTAAQYASLQEFGTRAGSDLHTHQSDFEAVAALLEAKPRQKHPFPFKCFTFQPGRRFLWWARFAILQFAIQKPLNTLISLILEFTCACLHEGSLSPSGGYLYLMILDNISISLAMYFLVLFYETTVEQLQPIKPLPKFLCIKAVIFFSFWQGVLIGILSVAGVITSIGSWSQENVQTGLQDFLIVIEMFFISILHHRIFSHEDYHIVDKTPFLRGILAGGVESSLSPLLQNFRDVANPRYDFDVTKETIIDPIGEFKNEMQSGFTLARVASELSIDSRDETDLP